MGRALLFLNHEFCRFFSKLAALLFLNHEIRSPLGQAHALSSPSRSRAGLISETREAGFSGTVEYVALCASR